MLFRPENLALLIPILIFIIPILAILTAHQRKMAEIIHNGQAQQSYNPEVGLLRQDLSELKALVHQQAIALDSLLAQSGTKPTMESSLQDRLPNGS
jgi:hypothetical protein